MDVLFGKIVDVYRVDKDSFEAGEVIQHYGEYSETCHKVFGGKKETWHYPDLIKVKFLSDGKISSGHFVDERHYAK